MIDPVTGRSVEALFRLAKARGALEPVRADVLRPAREFAPGSPGAYLFDARLPLETRRARARATLASLQPLTSDFVELLLDKRREQVLLGLAAAFHRRWLDEHGAAEGVVESARPLAPAEVDALARRLGAEFGRRLTLENKVVPVLLGGIRVLVGSRMLDASLRGRLEGLEKRLLAAPLPQPSEN
jgi:F-type H+-transporting ATPase subunit delta